MICERLVADLCDQLDAQIREAERERAIVAPPGHLGAWGLYHRGMWHAFRFDAAELDRAEGCFAQVLALAPEFGSKYAYQLFYVKHYHILLDFTTQLPNSYTETSNEHFK